MPTGLSGCAVGPGGGGRTEGLRPARPGPGTAGGSASGGGSTLLAQRMLERGGVVFGAVFDEAFLVYHGRIENMAELERFQGSKYPQSAVGDVYRQTKALLERGTPVLFTGTPCQIAGLRAYLARDYEGFSVRT
ncbi:MAG: hypothetical protein ACLSAF_12615 [Intestinimonas sp.]